MKAVAKTVGARCRTRGALRPHPAALSGGADLGRASAPASARCHQGRIRSPRPRRHQFGTGAAFVQYRRQGTDRRELRTRGYYLGSNVSYNLKKLVEMGFLDHQRSRVDRRSVRIKLTEKGRDVRDIVDALYQKHVRTVEQVGGITADEFGVLNKALHRLVSVLDRSNSLPALRSRSFLPGSPYRTGMSVPRRKCRGLFFFSLSQTLNSIIFPVVLPSQVRTGNGVKNLQQNCRSHKYGCVDQHHAQDPLGKRRVGRHIVGRPGKRLFPFVLRNMHRPDAFQWLPGAVCGNAALLRNGVSKPEKVAPSDQINEPSDCNARRNARMRQTR